MKIINYNNEEKYPFSIKDGSYGGVAGDKDGIVDNGEMWILKYPKNLSEMQGENASYSSSPLSEFLGSQIYKILGFPVHETKLGEKHGKIVVVCKDFATDGKNLLEIRTIKNRKSKELSELLDKKPRNSASAHIVDLGELLLHLDKNPILSVVPKIKERFFKQSIVDVLINNNDRNNGNWGIVRSPGKADELSPVFDNGSSFSTKINEEKIERFLRNEEKLTENATNVLTAYGYDEHHYNAIKFFEKVRNEPIFQQAILKMVPEIQNNIERIKELINSIPERYVCEDGKELIVCSSNRKEFYKKSLEARLEKILVPEYNKIMQLQQETEDTLENKIEQKRIDYRKEVKTLKDTKITTQEETL